MLCVRRFVWIVRNSKAFAPTSSPVKAGLVDQTYATHSQKAKQGESKATNERDNERERERAQVNMNLAALARKQIQSNHKRLPSSRQEPSGCFTHYCITR